jgi:putative transcriptional regulator
MYKRFLCPHVEYIYKENFGGGITLKRIRLNEARKSKGMTYADVASEVKISRSHYGLIENGQRNPSYKVAQRIVSYFNSSMNELFPDLIFFGNRCYERKQNNPQTA